LGEGAFMSDERIPGDRLVLGLISSFRTLVRELGRSNAIDLERYLGILEATADTHDKAGDPNRLAKTIRAIRDHIAESDAPESRSN
jgi:hypothetical protein